MSPESENNVNVEVQPQDGQSTPTEEKKPSKKKLIIIAALLIILIAAGVGGFLFMKNKKAKEEEAALLAKAQEPVIPQSIFLDLDEIIVNLNTDGKAVSFMKIKITLEIASASDEAIIIKLMPRIRDVFQVYMRELRPSDMQGSVGLYRLKEELLYRLNKLVYPAKVNDLLFKDVLIQ